MNEQTITIPVSGMSCTNCAMNIERGLSKVKGVNHISVNFATERASVKYLPDITSPE